MINSIIKENIKGEIISILYIIIVFILSVPLYKINPEFSRKEIHIMLGNFYFIALLYFTNWYFASFFPFLSIFLNYLIIKYKAIKYMIRVKKKDRNFGTVYYSISLSILTLYSWKIGKPEIGICPFLCMAYGDGLACVFGVTIKSPYKIIMGSKKSLVGSLTMFIICFFVHLIYFLYYEISLGLIKSIFMGLICMILEGITPFGLDNITVPLANLILINLLV